jgi:hypothetical protein
MKQRIILPFYLLFLAGRMSAQSTIDLGIFNSPANSNKLEIRAKSTQDYLPGYLSGLIFTIRFPATYAVSLSMDFAPPFFMTPSGQGTDDGYKYYSFQFGGNPFVVNWHAGTENAVGVVNIINEGGTGTGTFELVTQDPWTSTHNGNYYVELNGVSNHRTFFHASTAAPLPVELISFHAEALPNGSVGLDWKSASEKDLAYYQVEHSTDGRQFTALSKETARGAANVTTEYVYNHKSPEAGSNYYRLQMMDINGAFEYSPLRMVVIDREDADFTILPNPTSGPFLLTSRHLDKYKTGLTYQLTDNTGKLIRTEKITEEKTNFDLSNEPAGAYYLNILTDREQIVQFPVVVTSH